MSEVVHTDHHDDHDHGPEKGLLRWLYTTNHKDIGTLYLWFSFLMLLIGGALALVIRTELFQPGLQFIEPAFFNQMTTNHGLIMVFGAIMPAFSLSMAALVRATSAAVDSPVSRAAAGKMAAAAEQCRAAA